MSFVAVAVTTAVVATGLSAYGAYQSGVAQKKMAQFQSDAAAQQQELNARKADQDTTILQTQAAQDTKALQRKSLLISGAARAAQGANGTAGSGTSLDIDTSNFDTQKLDEMTIRYNADLQSWGIKEGMDVSNWDLENQKSQYSFAGKSAMKAGELGAATSILQGASQVASFGANYGALKGSKTNTGK